MEYPELARKNGTQGTVIIKVHVNEKGQILDTKVFKSLGDGCDEAAVKALRAANWKPATKNGSSISVWFGIDIQFKLN